MKYTLGFKSFQDIAIKYDNRNRIVFSVNIPHSYYDLSLVRYIIARHRQEWDFDLNDYHIKVS